MTAASPPPSLQELRDRIAKLERQGTKSSNDGVTRRGAVPLGPEPIDSMLPGGGLARGALHEVTAAVVEGSCLGEDSAAAGFCALLLGLFGQDRPVLWCGNDAAQGRGGLSGEIYLPGLTAFGVAAERLMLARARRDSEALWVVEEALRTPALAAVVAEVDDLGLVESRRLQLAAEERGVTAILLRPGGARLTPTAAATRWRVAAALAPVPDAADRRVEDAPMPGLLTDRNARPHWRLDLLRCRGGRPGSWHVAWEETGLTLLPPSPEIETETETGAEAEPELQVHIFRPASAATGV